MIYLKAVHISFIPTKQAFFHERRATILKSLRFCKSKNESDQEGDIHKQDLLAAIAMLEAQKVRVANYVDETAAYLTQTTEETTAEMNEIGEAAIKELNESSSKMMEEMESKMQAYEESAQEYRKEIQENDKKLADFEAQIAMERNDGMFFKSLGGSPSMDKIKSMDEVQKVKEVANAKASSKLRQNIYLALIGLLAIVIGNSFISVSSPDWRKVAVFGAILVGLITQYVLVGPRFIMELVDQSDAKLSSSNLQQRMEVVIQSQISD